MDHGESPTLQKNYGRYGSPPSTRRSIAAGTRCGPSCPLPGTTGTFRRARAHVHCCTHVLVLTRMHTHSRPLSQVDTHIPSYTYSHTHTFAQYTLMSLFPSPSLRPSLLPSSLPLFSFSSTPVFDVNLPDPYPTGVNRPDVDSTRGSDVTRRQCRGRHLTPVLWGIVRRPGLVPGIPPLRRRSRPSTGVPAPLPRTRGRDTHKPPSCSHKGPRRRGSRMDPGPNPSPTSPSRRRRTDGRDPSHRSPRGPRSAGLMSLLMPV